MNTMMPKAPGYARFAFEKLVTDGMLAIYANEGCRAKYRKLEREEHLIELYEKIQEEVAEVREAMHRNDAESVTCELGDLLDVLFCLAALRGIPEARLTMQAKTVRGTMDKAEIANTRINGAPDVVARGLAKLVAQVWIVAEACNIARVAIDEARLAKRQKKGSLLGGIYIEHLDVPLGSKWEAEFKAHPKYNYVGNVP